MHADLSEALWHGDLDAVQRLLAAGADPNAPDQVGIEPLVHAAANGVACFDALIAAGARLDANLLPRCLNWACHASEGAMVERLLDLGADVHAEACGETALHAAVDGRDIVIFDRVLVAVGDVDIRDRRGRTALHLAAMNRQVPFLQRLVDAGADVHAVDLEGVTALDLVLQRRGLACPEATPVGQAEEDTAGWLREAMARRRAL